MLCSHCSTPHELGIPSCPTCGANTDLTGTEQTVIETGSTQAKPDEFFAQTAREETLPSSEPDPQQTIINSDSTVATPRPIVAKPILNVSAAPGWTALARPDGLEGALCLLPGVVIGDRYQILKPLGEGGMGSVYKARDLEVDRLVALKVIKSELASNPQILQRFKQELLLARKVTHPNVVRIFDLGVAGSLRFITMEFIEGRELSSILAERGKLDSAEACEILLQVCLGLEAAHSQGVVHRDLKPQNIMVETSGRVAVMDFGIARSSDTAVAEFFVDARDEAPVALTRVGSLLGTPQYMSPEQARGQTVDTRSDIFSLGIIFYQMLTGRLPFNERTMKEVTTNRGTAPPPVVSELDPSVPKRVSELVRRCLQGKPDDRYQTTSELIADLETELGLRKKTRQVTIWTALATIAAVLAIGVSLFLFQQRSLELSARSHAPVTVLVSDFQNSTGNPILSGVVEPMVQVALEQTPFVTSFNRGQAQKAAGAIRPGGKLLDRNLARLVAIREGIGVVVSGNIDRDGASYRLSTTAFDANGKELVSADSGFKNPNELPKAVDSVSARIQKALGNASPSTSAASETFTSGSLESAQRYAEAQQLQWAGRWEDAIAAYRQAVALDPQMSRAYAGLGAMLANQGQRAEAVHYYQLALANLHRESNREKFRTRGGYYLLLRDYGKAVEQFSELLKQYPSDSAGVANLAFAYFCGRNMNAALEQGRKAVALSPNNVLQRNNVGLYAMYAGDFDSAIKESNTILRMNPSFGKAYLCLGIAQLQGGDPQGAEATFQKLAGLDKWGESEAPLAESDLALYQGHFRAAEALLKQAIAIDAGRKEKSSMALKMAVLSEAQLNGANKAAALRSAVDAVAASDDDSVVMIAASVSAQAGDRGKALAWGHKLSERFEAEPRALGMVIAGECQLLAGKLRDSISTLENAQKLADTWLGRFWLGRAYLAAKQYPQAENEFDICLRRRGEASSVFLDDEPTVRYLPPAYYYSGLCQQALGDPASSESFRTFLEIRKGGDISFQTADAQRRLNAK